MRLLLLLAGLAAASPALAQQAPGTPPAGKPGGRPGQPVATIVAEPVAVMIAAFDADGDAKVTRPEFDAGLARSWAGVAGGSASLIGYSDWAETWLGDRNALPSPFELDQNGDNRVTFDELSARFTLFFTRFDANKDGTIVRSELVSARSAGIQGLGERGRRRRVRDGE